MTRVSIHAPARGATVVCLSTNLIHKFQSTHPQGVRRPGTLTTGSWTVSFNPRTRKGCDLISAAIKKPNGEFQSTHPQGVRQPASKPHSYVSCFNPRTRKGCDSEYPISRFALDVSIHAPARGATRHGRVNAPLDVSIHAPARGATEKAFEVNRRFLVSIHAPARGATPARVLVTALSSFNPRTRKGAT